MADAKDALVGEYSCGTVRGPELLDCTDDAAIIRAFQETWVCRTDDYNKVY